MSTAKEEKPTLAGVNVKTRKRNVAVPLDPGSFADAVVTIFEEAVEEGQTSEQLLQAAVKKLETANLDFQRYGDTLFEVLFAGGRMASGGNLAADNKKKLDINVLACSPEHSEILPFVMAFQSLIRRKPFLVKALENMMCKLLQSLDFFSGDERQKVAIDRLFTVMLNDRLVAKGLVLDFLTAFFKEWLVAGNLEELVSLLTKAKVAGRIEDFFPQAKRSAEGVSEHLQESGLDALADWYKRRLAESQTLELHQGLADLMKEDPPAESVECESLVQEKKKAFDLPDTEVVKVVWTCLVESVNMTGKNQGQILQGIKQTVLRYKALLAGVASSAKLEVALLVAIQVSCYEDSKLLKVFKDIVQTLYGMDILGEDTIMYWYKKGSSPKGRNVLLKDIEPFIKWLEEADEEEDED